MSRLRFPRLAVAFVLVAGVVTVGVSARQASLYRESATVDRIVNGRSFYSFSHDPVAKRLYAASEDGLYWIDLDEPQARVKGPLVRKRLTSIEVVPDTRRIFYTTMDEVGMIDIESNAPPLRLAGKPWRTARWAFEPTRRQVYLPTRDSRILVFDASTGERSTDVVVPGEVPTMLEPIPGRLFFTLSDKSGLYTIDAASKKIAQWPIEGDLITPVYLDADPTGQYLFATYRQNVVTIDVASAKVVGRLHLGEHANIAFDPERRLLIAAYHDEPGHPRVKIVAYRIDNPGLTEVGTILNSADGETGLESLRSGGFLQGGRLSLHIWSPASARVASGVTRGLQ